jgi:hypothetical protein
MPSFDAKTRYFVANVGLREFCIFHEVKIVQVSSNRDVTDVTIELTTSNNNKAKTSRIALVVK